MNKLKNSSLIDKQIMWNRLLALVEEQAQVLQSTAFSTIVRESGDLAAGVFDRDGRMLAQAVTGTPGHINSMALAVGHVIDHYPIATMKPGDVFIHNDPWMGTGHTNDISITTPCYFDGRLVGFLASNSHVHDIGGLPDRVTSTDVYMEGLYLPILRIVEEGKVNETLIAVIRANTRQPTETVGDIYSLINCNEVACDRLREMMVEFDITDLHEVAEHIINTSMEAVLKKVAALPKGTWRASLTIDGREEPVVLKAAVTISDDGLLVDYAGSAPMTKRNFNVPLSYTTAYTSYALGIALLRDIPNNAGSLAPRRVSAPVGSIVNAVKPAAVISRHTIGLMLPDLIFNCLRQALPDQIPAESSNSPWNVVTIGPWDSPPDIANRFQAQMVTSGGMGALPYRDGMSATGFPSGVRSGPIEVFEAMSTLVIWRKEFRQDSGGAGKFRGGLGQRIELQNLLPEEFTFLCSYERVKFPARGDAGGLDGAPGSLTLDDGTILPAKGAHAIPAGRRIISESPGGGGIGAPSERDRGRVEEDVHSGIISWPAAREIYGL